MFEVPVKYHSAGDQGTVVLEAGQKSGWANIDLFLETVIGFMESFNLSHETTHWD